MCIYNIQNQGGKVTLWNHILKQQIRLLSIFTLSRLQNFSYDKYLAKNYDNYFANSQKSKKRRKEQVVSDKGPYLKQY